MIWLAVGVAAAAASLAAWLGWRLRAQRSRLEELAREREAERAAALELAAEAERRRIAREMHDVVAHTLAVMVAQADAARFTGRDNPAQAMACLDTIADVGRSALTEMSALLGLLRDGGEAPLGPQPSLADIPELVAQTRERGLEVSFVTTGTPRPLPIGAGLAVYRIVQEALTNALKHAGPRVTAYVQLRWEDDALAVSVADDGRGAAAAGDGAGQGLAGMAERATTFGGTCLAGPRAGGGFIVKARLPLAPRTASVTQEVP